MPNPEVYIVSAVRTAIGSFGGTLKDTPPCELATTAVSAALQRSGCAAERIGHVVMGNVIPTETRDAYISRVAAMNAGIPVKAIKPPLIAPQRAPISSAARIGMNIVRSPRDS